MLHRGMRMRRAWAEFRNARLSLGLLLLIGAVHALVSLGGHHDWIYTGFGLSRSGVAAGKVWQILTHAFLHGPWWHLALNAAAILLAGPKVERIGGAAAFLRVFLAGAVAGGLSQLLLTPESSQVLIGASGGIFALVLWLVTLSPGTKMWPIRVSARSFGLGIMVAEAALLVAGWWWPASGLAQVGNGCHLGGGIAGWLLARKRLGRMITREDLLRERARREADAP